MIAKTIKLPADLTTGNSGPFDGVPERVWLPDARQSRGVAGVEPPPRLWPPRPDWHRHVAIQRPDVVFSQPSQPTLAPVSRLRA
jgi:hypothetical protein